MAGDVCMYVQSLSMQSSSFASPVHDGESAGSLRAGVQPLLKAKRKAAYT